MLERAEQRATLMWWRQEPPREDLRGGFIGLISGARGLRSIMESILLATMFDLPGLDGVEEVVINREVAESRANPLYMYGKEKAESSA